MAAEITATSSSSSPALGAAGVDEGAACGCRLLMAAAMRDIPNMATIKIDRKIKTLPMPMSMRLTPSINISVIGIKKYLLALE